LVKELSIDIDDLIKYALQILTLYGNVHIMNLCSFLRLQMFTN